MITKKELQDYNFRKWLPKSFRWAALEFIIFAFHLALILAALITNNTQSIFTLGLIAGLWWLVGTYKNSHYYLHKVTEDITEIGKIAWWYIDKNKLKEAAHALKSFTENDSYVAKEGKRFNEKS